MAWVMISKCLLLLLLLSLFGCIDDGEKSITEKLSSIEYKHEHLKNSSKFLNSVEVSEFKAKMNLFKEENALVSDDIKKSFEELKFYSSIMYLENDLNAGYIEVLIQPHHQGSYISTVSKSNTAMFKALVDNFYKELP